MSDELEALKAEVELLREANNALRIAPDSVEVMLGIDPNDPLEQMAEAAVKAVARAEAAEADAAGLRARMLRLADEWDEVLESPLAVHAVPRDVVTDLRALAAEPTPDADPFAFCVCDHDQRHHLHGFGPCSRDIHETGALCDCRRFAESALSREVNRPTTVAEPHAEDGAP